MGKARGLWRLIALGACLIVAGCGEFEEPVDAELRPYVEVFEEEMGTTIDFRVKLKRKVWKVGAGEVPASCRAAKGGRGPKVVVSEDYWEEASETYRFHKIWHELGHCQYGLPHANATYANGEPKSLMHGDTSPSEAWLEDKRQEYIEELRTRVRDPKTGCVWFLWRACNNRP
jgi:hypothetical protein